MSPWPASCSTSTPTWSPDNTGPSSRRTCRVVDANARAGGRCRPAQRAREDGDTAMMGMIAAAAVLLGFALLAFWTDVENARAWHTARRFDRTYERNRARRR